VFPPVLHNIYFIRLWHNIAICAESAVKHQANKNKSMRIDGVKMGIRPQSLQSRFAPSLRADGVRGVKPPPPFYIAVWGKLTSSVR